VLVALGKEAPFFKVVYYSIPGASLFRQPGRYLAVLTLAMSALSALGFDRLWKAGPDLRRSTRVAAIGVAAILGAILLTLAVWNDPAPWSRFVTAQFADGDNLVSESVRNDPAFPEQARRHARAALVGAAVTLAVLSACLFGYSPDRRGARLSATALGVLLAAELTVFGHGFLKSYESRLIAWPSDFVDFVKNRPGGPYRVVSPGRRNLSHIGKCQLAGLDHVAGYESMVLRRYCELINVVHGRPPDVVRMVSTVDVPHPVLDMLGAKFWLVEEGLAVPPGWKALGKVNDGTNDSVVLESPSAFPRAFVVSQAVTIRDRDERLGFLKNPPVDLRRTVVLEEPQAPTAPAGAVGPGSATVDVRGAGRYEISSDSSSEGYLVLTETYFPGWEARIDGLPAEVLRANHLVQAVRLPAGRHLVTFEYRSRRLRLGFLVSALVALGTLLGALRLRQRA